MDEAFNAAVKLIHSLPEKGPINLGYNEKLNFYSLYKIATLGKNLPKKPSMIFLESTIKWNAWKNHLCEDQEEAKKQYIQEIGKVLRNIYHSGKSEEYLNSADMSFLNKLNRREIDVLMNQVLTDKTLTNEERDTIIILFNRFIK